MSSLCCNHLLDLQNQLGNPSKHLNYQVVQNKEYFAEGLLILVNDILHQKCFIMSRTSEYIKSGLNRSVDGILASVTS